MTGRLRRTVGAVLLAMAATCADARAPMADVDAVVHLRPEDATLRVDGLIGERFERDVRAALRRHRDVRRIVVNSRGGLRAPALRIGALANARGLTVRVDGRCASACVLLWATARSREMTARSRIGLHGSSLDPSLPLPPPLRARIVSRNDRETDAVLRRAGFPPHVIALGAATPPTAMAWFTPGELDRGALAFVLLDVASAAPTPGSTGASIAGLE